MQPSRNRRLLLVGAALHTLTEVVADHLLTTYHSTTTCTGNPFISYASFPTGCISSGSMSISYVCVNSSAAANYNYASADCSGSPVSGPTYATGYAFGCTTDSGLSYKQSCVTGQFTPPTTGLIGRQYSSVAAGCPPVTGAPTSIVVTPTDVCIAMGGSAYGRTFCNSTGGVNLMFMDSACATAVIGVQFYPLCNSAQSTVYTCVGPTPPPYAMGYPISGAPPASPSSASTPSGTAAASPSRSAAATASPTGTPQSRTPSGSTGASPSPSPTASLTASMTGTLTATLTRGAAASQSSAATPTRSPAAVSASVIIYAAGAADCSGASSSVLRVGHCSPVQVNPATTLYLTVTDCSNGVALVDNFQGDSSCSVAPTSGRYNASGCSLANALGPGSPPVLIACCPVGSSEFDSTRGCIAAGGGGGGGGGTDAGVAVGVVFAILILAGAAFYVSKRKRFAARHLISTSKSASSMSSSAAGSTGGQEGVYAVQAQGDASYSTSVVSVTNVLHAGQA